MTSRKTASEKPRRPVGRPRSSAPKADAARFLAALGELGHTPESFAKRIGIGRRTAYRWLQAKPPRWAWFIIELLRDRRPPAE